MTIDPLDIGRKRILADPCNRNVTQRNWGAMQDLVDDIADKIEEIITTININNIGDTTTIINQIVVHNTFVTQVNNLVDSRITNYFNALYANVILFTLQADLAVGAGGTWEANATVNSSWNGAAPLATVKVIDPAAKWRWTAPSGAKGVAIRASSDGTIYAIMEVETIASLIRFVVKYDFAKTVKSVSTANVDRMFIDRLNPTALFGANDLILENPQAMGTNTYRFSGVSGARGEAVLIYRTAKPANTANEPVYAVIQLECGV